MRIDRTSERAGAIDSAGYADGIEHNRSVSGRVSCEDSERTLASQTSTPNLAGALQYARHRADTAVTMADAVRWTDVLACLRGVNAHGQVKRMRDKQGKGGRSYARSRGG